MVKVGSQTYANPEFSHDKVTNRRKFTGVHFHNDYELYYLIEGKTKYFIGDEIFLVEKGNFIMVPKQMFHKTDSEECTYNERILVSINPGIFDNYTQPIIDELCAEKQIYIPENKKYKAEEILKKLEKECTHPKKHSDIMKKLYIIELLTLLSRLKQDYNPSLKDADTMVDNISEYIRQNYGGDLSLNVLSKIFAVSESHLSRKFKDISGMGLNEYITYVRIMNAQKMLESQKLSVTEIAAKCGFNDSAYFAAVFKKTKGITPYKYKKSYYDI